MRARRRERTPALTVPLPVRWGCWWASSPRSRSPPRRPATCLPERSPIGVAVLVWLMLALRVTRLEPAGPRGDGPAPPGGAGVREPRALPLAPAGAAAMPAARRGSHRASVCVLQKHSQIPLSISSVDHYCVARASDPTVSGRCRRRCGLRQDQPASRRAAAGASAAGRLAADGVCRCGDPEASGVSRPTVFDPAGPVRGRRSDAGSGRWQRSWSQGVDTGGEDRRDR